jgi:putative colanic acid biosynthesis acetyltransferase WcaF
VGALMVEGNLPSHGPSFPLGNRGRRQVWYIVQALLFRTSPRPFHSWRAFLLRLFGVKLGARCHVHPRVRIWAPWNLELGDHVRVAEDVILYSMDRITTGDYAVISQGAHL